VQQMVQLFEKQLADQRDFVRSGLAGMEGSFYCYLVAPTYAALELEALHSFGKGLVVLLGSWCTDPSECERCFESNSWAAWRARFGKGTSSKDGLHHLYLKPTLISSMQATLSLSLASTGSSNFDLSWLDGLPAADDSKLHGCFISTHTFANQRVVIAEVFEWQGRYKEAIRCVHFHAHSCISIRSHPLTSYCSIAALQQPIYKTASTSPRRRKCAQAGFSADVTLHWGSMPSRCRHSMQPSSWRSVDVFCCQRRYQSEAGCLQAKRAKAVGVGVGCTGTNAKGSSGWLR
jgi:hypothetical protein